MLWARTINATIEMAKKTNVMVSKRKKEKIEKLSLIYNDMGTYYN